MCCDHLSGAVWLMLLSVLGGCAIPSPDPKRQEDIGLGIVEGIKGYRQLQKDHLSFMAIKKVQGQVLQIEGAAYVVHLRNRTEARLPVDEHTRIDRPAHVGDWIEAHLDQSGRAMIIRNIDDEITLE